MNGPKAIYYMCVYRMAWGAISLRLLSVTSNSCRPSLMLRQVLTGSLALRQPVVYVAC